MTKETNVWLLHLPLKDILAVFNDNQISTTFLNIALKKRCIIQYNKGRKKNVFVKIDIKHPHFIIFFYS